MVDRACGEIKEVEILERRPLWRERERGVLICFVLVLWGGGGKDGREVGDVGRDV